VRHGHKSNKKLGAIGVTARISHGEQVRPVVAELEVFIWESTPVYALSASSITSSKITTLGHKPGNYAVKLAALEVQGSPETAPPFFSRAQGAEVFTSTRDDRIE